MKGIHKITQNVLTNFSVKLGQSYVANKPIYIFLEVTNRCNLACIMCGRTHDPRYEMPGHCGDLSLQRVKRLDSFFPFATFTIPTGVGEPFINLELVPILKYLKSKGTQVSLTSNGTLLNKVHAIEIIKCGLDKIVFSIDGATKRTFEKIRVHANFDLIMNNIRRLQQLKKEFNSPYPVVEFELVAMADNFPELPMWAEMAGELGIQGLIVQNLFDHSGEPYQQVYRAQNLKNIPYQRGVKIWEEFLRAARSHNLYVNSPYLEQDLKTVFGADVPPNFERPLGVVAYGVKGNGQGNGNGQVYGQGNGESNGNGHGNGDGNGNGRLTAFDSANGQGNPATRDCRSQEKAEALVQIHSQPETQQMEHPPSPRSQGDRGDGEDGLRPMYCTQPWSVMYMAWNGDIRTCCFNDYALGHIDRNTIEEIWNGPRYRAMRRSIAQGHVLDVCRDCLNGHSNYSVVPKLDPALLYKEIRAVFHQALM